MENIGYLTSSSFAPGGQMSPLYIFLHVQHTIFLCLTSMNVKEAAHSLKPFTFRYSICRNTIYMVRMASPWGWALCHTIIGLCSESSPCTIHSMWSTICRFSHYACECCLARSHWTWCGHVLELGLAQQCSWTGLGIARY